MITYQGCLKAAYWLAGTVMGFGFGWALRAWWEFASPPKHTRE